MKKLLIFIFFDFLSGNHLYSQNLSFPGTAPSISLTVHLKRINISFLSANKFRLGDHRVKEVGYEQQWLEIYSQVLASYKINDHWQIATGYGFQRNNPLKDNWRNEHRLVQQVMHVVQSKSFNFYNRFRFEERWFSYPSSPNAFGTRARYQAGIIKQLNNKMTYWQLNNEIYAITSGPHNSFISENWLYTGVGFPVRSLGQFETGIGYNSVIRNAEKELMSLILLQISWGLVIPSKMKMQMPLVMHARQF